MKKYSSNRAQKGKTAYRTPSRFRVTQTLFAKLRTSHINTPSFQRRSRQRPQGFAVITGLVLGVVVVIVVVLWVVLSN